MVQDVKPANIDKTIYYVLLIVTVILISLKMTLKITVKMAVIKILQTQIIRGKDRFIQYKKYL